MAREFDCYNIFITRIAIIEFYVNVISDFIFTIILYLFLLCSILEVNIVKFSFQFFYVYFPLNFLYNLKSLN